MRKDVINIIAILLFLINYSHGQILVHEPFDYNVPGKGAIEGKGGGVGFSSLWQVSAPYITYDYVANTGKCGPLAVPSGYGDGGSEGEYAVVSGIGATGGVSRTLETTINFDPPSDQTYYFSMLFRRYEVSNGGGTEMVRLFNLRDSSSSEGPRLIIGTTSTEEGWVVLGGYENAAMTSTSVFEPTIKYDFLNTGLTNDYLVVARLTVSSSSDDVVSVKFYKSGVDNVSTEPADWDISYQYDVSGYADELSTSIQDYGGELHFDEIRVGETWSDVVASF
jgi:hypothetical protein